MKGTVIVVPGRRGGDPQESSGKLEAVTLVVCEPTNDQRRLALDGGYGRNGASCAEDNLGVVIMYHAGAVVHFQMTRELVTEIMSRYEGTRRS